MVFIYALSEALFKKWTCFDSQFQRLSIKLNLTLSYPYYLKDPPELTSNPSDEETVNKDAILRLSCVATGNGLPSFTWYKDGELITTNSTHTITNAAQQPDAYSTTSSFKITGVDTSHAGLYSCNATNALGEASFVTNVDVLCKFQILCNTKCIVLSIWIIMSKKTSFLFFILTIANTNRFYFFIIIEINNKLTWY